ncbi:hypothetical protein J7I93_20630 [Bacillus sp. ISL-47]|uniref:hypothetical protein n=1 Tax=Bacillus sp. ISL-47 TaxID=2819130 RepID=UPI001BE5485B|nr:hypothetical protein [Bacillus sp. ISL-47]MBT2690566.1 hypothetical protein [Bacillus sp. ISL-47]MBT2710911.1 hypothetical protein [Pseudomonas sp. ISL-84]
MFNWLRKKNAPQAAGMNFDLEEVEPLLKRLNSILDTGFKESDRKEIQSQINQMSTDHEVKEIGTYKVVYKGKQAQIRIEAEIHIEGDSREVVLNMYSQPKLVQAIDEKMLEHSDELEALSE